MKFTLKPKFLNLLHSTSLGAFPPNAAQPIVQNTPTFSYKHSPDHCLKPNTLATQFDDFFLIIYSNLKNAKLTLRISLPTAKHLSLETHVVLSDVKCQLNWPCLISIHTGMFIGVWRYIDIFSLMRLYTDYIFFCIFAFFLGEALHRLHTFLHFGINCSYVRVLFGYFGPEYITHLINYGQITQKV